MKILEEGTGWNLEVRCTGKGNGDGGCGARLLVEAGDIYQTHSWDMYGDRDDYFTICCPQCGIETDIDPDLIPYGIQHKTLSKKLVR